MAGRGHDLAGGDQEREPEWLRYLNHQSDWLEKTRGNLMVVATVIASMSFQVMVNPPGGVWQDDKCSPNQTAGQPSPASSPARAPVCKSVAGTSVLEYRKPLFYLGVVISSTVSFSASMGLILLVISGMRLRNRFVMGMLILFMVVAVLCIAAAFAFSVLLVQSDDDIIRFVLYGYVVFWVVFPNVILVVQLVRFLVWVLCLVFSCCKPRRRPVRPVHPQFPNQAGPSA